MYTIFLIPHCFPDEEFSTIGKYTSILPYWYLVYDRGVCFRQILKTIIGCRNRRIYIFFRCLIVHRFNIILYVFRLFDFLQPLRLIFFRFFDIWFIIFGLILVHWAAGYFIN